MGTECTDIEREAARAGDRYYQALTEWLTKRYESAEMRQKVSLFGRIYSGSLHLMIKCLDRLGSNPRAAQKIEAAEDLQTKLQRDLAILDGPGTSLTPQTEEL